MKLTTFMYEGAQVRTVIIEEQPWLVVKDVCDILEISNPTVAIQRLDADEVTKFNLGGLHGEVNVVNEYGMYSLILGSRKAEARAFKRWVTHEVLPQIRKTGSYQPQLPQNYKEALLALIGQVEKTELLEVKLEQQKPLVGFAELCMQSNQTIKVRDLAHSLASHGIKIGQNKLFEKLREWKYIAIKSTEPTQRAIELGLFEVVTGVKQKPSGDPFTWRTPYATVKGQIHIAERLRKEAIQ